MDAIPVRQTSTLAVVSMVCGILSWLLLPFVGAVAAVVTGHMARSEIRTGRYDGDGFAITGLVLGYLHLALVLIGIAVLFLFLGGLAWFGLSH